MASGRWRHDEGAVGPGSDRSEPDRAGARKGANATCRRTAVASRCRPSLPAPTGMISVSWATSSGPGSPAAAGRPATAAEPVRRRRLRQPAGLEHHPRTGVSIPCALPRRGEDPAAEGPLSPTAPLGGGGLPLLVHPVPETARSLREDRAELPRLASPGGRHHHLPPDDSAVRSILTRRSHYLGILLSPCSAASSACTCPSLPSTTNAARAWCHCRIASLHSPKAAYTFPRPACVDAAASCSPSSR